MVEQNVANTNKELMRYAGRNLQSSNAQLPFTEWVGTITGWDIDNREDFNKKLVPFIVFSFNKLQIITMRPDASPYVLESCDFAIKHSDAERSGFGFVQTSINNALGLSKEDSDLFLVEGKEWHVTSHLFNWGKIPGSTKMDENGDTWGEVFTFALAGATPVAANNVSAPVAANPTAPVGNLTGEQIALQLLHGKTLAQWLPAIMSQETIKADVALSGSITNQTWLASMTAAGTITVDPATGVYNVLTPF